MDVRAIVAQLLACLTQNEKTLLLPLFFQEKLIFDSHISAFLFDNEAAAIFHHLHLSAYQHGISICACYIRFTAKFHAITVERRIDPCWHVPFWLCWLLCICYQIDGFYIDFQCT